MKISQDVVDFILGYGKYLEELGFTFSPFREDTYDVSDWQTSVREFYIDYTKLGSWYSFSLSPGADKINFTSNYATAQCFRNIFWL